MNRSLSLLSAITLSSAALLSVQPQEASAMAIAFDCFERSTEKLVARSAVDMTSTTISCLPVPGNPITVDSSIDSDEGDILEIDNPGEDEPLLPGEDEELFPEEGDLSSVDEYEDNDDEDQIGGDTTSDKISDLLGHLIRKGINDLMR
ncbi:hypothetical protein [Synechococcus sp. RS9916]|uniref:hypothetical protein n=1 Tax=Synechococcus sp. RS9916 TaxID=221359 RepID=UPI0000E535CD|nr:hypothetical protein [Synechococcus sp. RS9916]EAU75132.1 hypothetical protein RS9916_36532 [Synechococcus sp. RS9916]